MEDTKAVFNSERAFVMQDQTQSEKYQQASLMNEEKNDTIQRPALAREESMESQFFLSGLYIGVVLLFLAVWLQSPPCKDCFLNFYTNIYLVVAFIGALLGFRKLLGFRRLQSFRQSISDPSYLSSAIFCFGLLLWSFGQMTWLIYNFALGVNVPYPSPADIGYILNMMCWTIGLFVMYKLAGTNPFQEIANIAPFVIAAWGGTGTLMLLARGGTLQNPPSDVLKFLLDIILPIIDAFNLALLVPLFLGPLFNKFSRGMKVALSLILLGTISNYVGDLGFSITPISS